MYWPIKDNEAGGYVKSDFSLNSDQWCQKRDSKYQRSWRGKEKNSLGLDMLNLSCLHGNVYESSAQEDAGLGEMHRNQPHREQLASYVGLRHLRTPSIHTEHGYGNLPLHLEYWGLKSRPARWAAQQALGSVADLCAHLHRQAHRHECQQAWCVCAHAHTKTTGIS